MPRDFLLIVGDEIIEATMTWRSRYFEYLAYRPLALNYWRQGAKWTIGPKPTNFSKLIRVSYQQFLSTVIIVSERTSFSKEMFFL